MRLWYPREGLLRRKFHLLGLLFRNLLLLTILLLGGGGTIPDPIAFCVGFVGFCWNAVPFFRAQGLEERIIGWLGLGVAFGWLYIVAVDLGLL